MIKKIYTVISKIITFIKGLSGSKIEITRKTENKDSSYTAIRVDGNSHDNIICDNTIIIEKHTNKE